MNPSPVLLRACGRGNQIACDIARKLRVMYASSVLSFSDVNLHQDHDNKLPFTGTLLLTDVPSDKPPHGSEGHRIFVSKKAALAALSGLVGQAINYQPEGLNAHASRHKVGVITKAWMEGNKVKVAGQIWIHDFPEARVLKGRKDLGMSMELSSVYVDDDEADVWVLDKFDFTGATILKKNAAAYTKTDLAAVAAAAKVSKGETMPKHKEGKEKVAAARRDTGQRGDSNSLALAIQAMGGQLSTAVQNGMNPVVAEIKASNERVLEGLEEIKGLHLIQAASEIDDDDEDGIVLNAAEDASASDEEEEEEMEASASEASDMEAAQHDDDEEDDEEDESSASASESDMEAMEDLSLEDASEEPGEVNKDASSKGSKTKVTKPPNQGEHFKGTVAKGRLHSSARKVKAQGNHVKKNNPTTSTIQAATLIGDLQASVRQMRRQMKAQALQYQQVVGKLRKKVSRLAAQAENFARLEGRRSSMSHELVSLGQKVGVNFEEVRTNGQKYSVRAFDNILAAAAQAGVELSPRQRVTMKMLAEQEGVIDDGVVDRGIGRA